jgi:hypothetical protein
MNVYGPGRHFLAILNACIRPATTLSGKPCVYLSMSENPRHRMDIGLDAPAPLRSYRVCTPARDSRSHTSAYLVSVGMIPHVPFSY